MGQLAINSMALPPILLAGKEWMKEQVNSPVFKPYFCIACRSRCARVCGQVCRPVIRGDINCSLAISEPYVHCATCILGARLPTRSQPGSNTPRVQVVLYPLRT
jgi:hypothetical protein